MKRKHIIMVMVAIALLVGLVILQTIRARNAQTPEPTATQTQVRFLQESIVGLKQQNVAIMEAVKELDAMQVGYFDKLDSLNEVSADQLSDIRRYNLQGRDAIRQLRVSMEKLQPEINELAIEAEKFEE